MSTLRLGLGDACFWLDRNCLESTRWLFVSKGLEPACEHVIVFISNGFSQRVGQHAIGAMADPGRASPARFSDSPPVVEVAAVRLRRIPWGQPDSAGGTLVQIKAELQENDQLCQNVEELQVSEQQVKVEQHAEQHEDAAGCSHEVADAAAPTSAEAASESTGSPAATPPGERPTWDMLVAIRDGEFNYNCSANEQSRWIRAQCKLEKLECEAKSAKAPAGSPSRRWAASALCPDRSAPSPSDEDVRRVLSLLDAEDDAQACSSLEPLKPPEPPETTTATRGGISEWLALRAEREAAEDDWEQQPDIQQQPSLEAAQAAEEDDEEEGRPGADQLQNGAEDDAAAPVKKNKKKKRRAQARANEEETGGIMLQDSFKRKEARRKKKKKQKKKDTVVSDAKVEEMSEEDPATEEQHKEWKRQYRSNPSRAVDKTRNDRCCAQMRFGRAVKRLKAGLPSGIPTALQSEALINPKLLFGKFFRNDCNWEALGQIRNTSTVETETDNDRNWVFKHIFMRDFTEAEDVGEKMWAALCDTPGKHRFHPDMVVPGKEPDPSALQVAYLTKDSKKNRTKDATSVDATFTQKGTVSQLGNQLQIEDPTSTNLTPKADPVPKVAQAAIEDAKDDSGGKGAVKPKKLTKEQLKEALLEEQRKEREKKEKAAQPLERGKALLRKCPVAIRELSLALNDLKVPAIKKCMPARFHSEYAHALGSHMQTLNKIRQLLESSMCKDEKIFTRRIGESMDLGEKELEQTSMTLKAWKNSLHVYGGTKHSSSAKAGKPKNKPEETNEKPSSSTAQPPKKKRKA